MSQESRFTVRRHTRAALFGCALTLGSFVLGALNLPAPPSTGGLWIASARAAEPSAADVEAGREAAGEAMGHYGEGAYEDALVSFAKARKLYPAGQVLRMTGYTLLALERWIEAADAIEEALETDLKPLLPRDAEHAEDNLKKALTHVALITIRSKVDDATLTIDDDERPLGKELKLVPGSHRIVVEAPGREAIEREQDLAGGSETKLNLDPPRPKSAPPPPPPKPEPEPEAEPLDFYGWFPHQGTIGLATAGAGIVMGGIALGTGVYGLSMRGAVEENITAHNSNFDSSCSSNAALCEHDAALINRDGDTAAGLQNTGIALGITAGSLITVGAVLYLFSEESPLNDQPLSDQPAEEGTSKDARRGLPTCLPFGLPTAEGDSAYGATGGLSCVGQF